MSFPRRPSQNEDPWFQARETYDKEIERKLGNITMRGEIPPEITHIDELSHLQDHVGTWWASAENLPAGTPLPSTRNTVHITVEASGASAAVKQTLTTTDVEFWRRSTRLVNGRAGGWFDWNRNVVSPDIARIFRSKDAEYPIGNLDLLVLIETPSYFTDFSDQIIGEAPSGWTPRWADEGLHTIQRNPSSSNGVVLYHPEGSSGDIAIKALSMDILDGITDIEDPIEVTFKWRGGPETQPRAFTHGSGQVRSTINGLFGGYFNLRNTDGMVSFNDGTSSDLFYSPRDLVPNDGSWFITRFRAHPNKDLKIRTWKNGHPEPKSWHRTVTLTSLPVGWIGLATVGSGWTEYDWFGVALEGGRAPIGG